MARKLEEEPPRVGVQVRCLSNLPADAHHLHCLLRKACSKSASQRRASPKCASDALMSRCRLWTDEDNYNLIKDHYAWFLDTYESLPKPVMKADSARYLYMYHIGGTSQDPCLASQLVTLSLCKSCADIPL